ncbi:MAG: phenylalanine--tRNA ligase subunit alpha [Promethearchaeota archaeon]
MGNIELSDIAIKVLKQLKKENRPIEARDLCNKMKEDYEVVMNQGVFELTQQDLAKFSERHVTELIPTDEMKEYIEKGLPERRLFKMLMEHGKEYIIEEFKKDSGMDPQKFFIGLTYMKKNRWARESKATSKPTIFVYDESAPKSEVEKIIEYFKNKDKIILEDIPEKLKGSVKILRKRKLIDVISYNERIISLTSKGKSIKLTEIKKKGKYISRITHEMLLDGSWRNVIDKIKPFEVANKGAKLFGGKLHPLTILINQIREIFLSMGFIEIKGPMVESAFYNFDSLFQPQDHPCRELHDTFYLSNPSKAKLPAKKWVNAVKITHETGGTCGSLGWNYKWDEDIAKKTILRTHMTATTIRRLSKVIRDKEKLPLKVFCIDRVFRNENVDATHLAEFMQVEGIVIGENVNLCQLRGLLQEFYRKMGFPKVITRPGFFPYTEPSLEISVYSTELGQWLEMGGSGIFRPEVCSPWGINEPIRVLAWGQGFERLAMLRLGRTDIRDLYRSPLSWLREVEYTKQI